MFLRFFKKASPPSRNARPTVARDERVYAIGDIHGRVDLLQALLEKVLEEWSEMSDHRQPRLIFLGDYIDRGDNSKDVLDLLVEVQEKLEDTCSFLLGNHEAAMLSFLADPYRGSRWLDWGGRQTLTSYGIGLPGREPGRAELNEIRDALYAKSEHHLDFLNDLKKYETSGDVVFAHACTDPTLDLDAQPDDALLWGHVPSGQDAGLPGRLLVHGHFDAFEPITTATRICVDTGAYYSGRLTAVRLDDLETFVTVNAGDLLP